MLKSYQSRPACCLLPVSWISLILWSLIVTSSQKWYRHVPSMLGPQRWGNALYLQSEGADIETSRSTRYQTLLTQRNNHTDVGKMDICTHSLPPSHSSVTIWDDMEFLKETRALPFPAHSPLPSCLLNNSPIVKLLLNSVPFHVLVQASLYVICEKPSLTASRPPCHVSNDLMRCSTGLFITKLLPLRLKFVLDHNKFFAHVQGQSYRLNDVLKHSLRFQSDIKITNKRESAHEVWCSAGVCSMSPMWSTIDKSSKSSQKPWKAGVLPHMTILWKRVAG